MRHKIAGNKLGRNSSWRKATVRDIAKATLIQQRIKTTEAKAKEARKLVDKLITLGKKGSLAHKRRAFSILCDHKLVSELFSKIAVRFAQRQGGYTRIIKLATNRKGDNAKVVFLELTEKDQSVLVDDKKALKQASKKAKAEKKVESDDVSGADIKEDKQFDTKSVKISAKDKNKGSGLKKIFRRKKEK